MNKKIAPKERGFFQLWKVGSSPKVIEINGSLSGEVKLNTGEILNTNTGEIYPPEIVTTSDGIYFGTSRIKFKISKESIIILVFLFLNESETVPDIKIIYSKDTKTISSLIQRNSHFNFSLEEFFRDFRIDSVEGFLNISEIKEYLKLCKNTEVEEILLNSI